jgi:hypothetical protein
MPAWNVSAIFAKPPRRVRHLAIHRENSLLRHNNLTDIVDNTCSL